jgi:Phosphotransferase enzyme family
METLLKRSGYGASFNNIYVTPKTIRKECKNEYGRVKIEKEMKFYRHLREQNVGFSTPAIYDMNSTSYTMENLIGYVSLYTVFSEFPPDKKERLLKRVYDELDALHQSSSMMISKEMLQESLQIETHTKILERVEHVKDLVGNYSHIQKVNGMVLKSFNTILSLISQKIQGYINRVDTVRLCLIHGDCQFNNVLYNPSTQHIAFIDPRGYFGSFDLYGMPEYDRAKVLFALSGYDIFDNMDTVVLDIDGDTLHIPNLFQIEEKDNDPLFKKDDIVSVLAISVWLGNAHCFKHNPPKAVFSYFYAMYLASKYL